MADRFARARRAYRRHLALFIGVNVALQVVNFFVGTGWWAFWPLAAWGVVFMVHFLRYKVQTVDEGWVDARAAELRIKSYDRGHIDNIAAHGPGAAGREKDARGN
ncbi:MAG: 2TM domain-containing protein [Gammaproteobacteria bacterium]|nr:2TM domain-containing protein [Gammaproteobacteria bacterium]